jgi:hypothetical protein
MWENSVCWFRLRVESLEPERFEFLSTAAEAVRDVTPADSPAEALEQYRALLFHSYHFWSAGKRLFVFSPAAARFVVETSPSLDGWSFRMPSSTAYLQMPANLFWSSISPQSAPEPVDGFFLTLTERMDHRQRLVGHLDILVVLGVRRGRAGFSVIPLKTEIGPGIDDALAEVPRPEGDFANVLPGGEISGLYSILTTSEALKLIARTLAYIDRFPDALTDVDAPEPRADGEDQPPTSLAYTYVTLGGDPRGEPHG